MWMAPACLGGKTNLPLIFTLEVGVTGDVLITDGKPRYADEGCLGADSAGACVFLLDEADCPRFTLDGTRRLLLEADGTAEGTADGTQSGIGSPCLGAFLILSNS